MLTLNYLLADHLCRITRNKERCKIPFKDDGKDIELNDDDKTFHYSCTKNGNWNSWCQKITGSDWWDYCDKRCGGKMCTIDWNLFQLWTIHYRIQYWVWFKHYIYLPCSGYQEWRTEHRVRWTGDGGHPWDGTADGGRWSSRFWQSLVCQGRRGMEDNPQEPS